MAMIFYTSETEMFIPQQYNEQTLRLTHRALANHARFQMLLNVVLDRDFSHLWHAPALLQMFRHWCTLCGAWFHTAALMTHQLTHHHDGLYVGGPAQISTGPMHADGTATGLSVQILQVVFQ